MIIDTSVSDYSDFLAECDSQNLAPEEKIREIITCYVILRQNRRKLSQKILDPFLDMSKQSTSKCRSAENVIE
jgi:hypothetical protein